MAEFGIRATQLSAPQGAGANVVQGVETPPSHALAYSIPGGIAEILGAGVKTLFEKPDPSKEILKQFTKETNALVDAAAQGAISGSEALDRKQALFRRYSSEFPDLMKPLQEIGGWTGKYSGFEDLEQQENDRRAIETEFRKRAAQSGFWIDETTPPEVVDKIRSFISEADYTAQVIQNEQQKLNYAASKDDYSFQVAQRELKEKTESVALNLADSMFTAMDANIDGIRLKLENGAPDMNPEVALEQVRNLSSQFNQQLAKLEIIDPQRASAIRRVLEEQIANAEKLFDPNVSAEIKAGIVKQRLNQTKIVLTADRNILTQVGLQDMFKNTDVMAYSNASAVLNGAALLMQGYKDPTARPQPIVGRGASVGEKEIYTTFKQSVDAWKNADFSGINSSEAIGYLSEGANNILMQFGDLVNDQKATPNDYVAAIDFMQSNQFREIVKAGKLSPEAKANAETALIYGFRESGAVRGTLNEKLHKTFKMPQSSVYYGDPDQGSFEYVDAILPRFDKGSGSLSFGADPEFQAGPFQRQAVNSIIKEFDNQKKALNYAIRAHANLLDMDVGEYWEQNKHQILPEYFPDPNVLKVGHVDQGMEYIGGPPARKSSWRPVSNGDGNGQE